MLQKISCPHCGGHISFEEESLGASVNCPHCQQPITLTAPAAPLNNESRNEPKATVSLGKKLPLLHFRWLAVAGSVIILAGAGVFLFLWFRSPPGDVATLPTDQQLTVGLVSFQPDKVAINNNTQYQVTLHKDFSVPTIYLCDVTFSQKPAPAEVDKILRDSLEQCVKKDGTQEILAMAYLKDTALRPPDYSGPLVWSPEQKAIKPFKD